MAIPSVNVTVVDGALNSPPANASKVAVKMGICSAATATVQASKLIGSTTGGDGVTYTAKSATAPGAAGNLINITYNAPTGGSVIVVVSGNTIVVTPKTGAVNSDIVTAIGANAQANALVSAVATGAGDLVIAVSQTYLTGGVTGTINTVIPEANPTQVVTDLGYGPLPEATCHALTVAGGSALCMPLNPTNAGTASSVSQLGTGPAVTVAGTPNDAYSAIVKIVQGGVLGAAQFQYSQDGGNLYSATFVVPSGGSFVVPNTGLTLTFAAGTYVLGTLYTFGSTASGYTITDVQNAFAALQANGAAFGFLHLIGTASSVAGSASMAAALETLLLSEASTQFRYVHADMECAQDTDANIESAFASTVCTRVDVCAGFETVTSSIPGSGTLTRNIGFSVAAREALVPEQNDLGNVEDGALPGVQSLLRNEMVTPGLDALNFTTARTLPGQKGFFITTGHMLESPGSDFALSQNRRVMDLACTVAYAATVPFLNSTLRVNPNGTIAAAQAVTIQNQVGGQLSSGVVAPGAAVSASVVIDQTNNVLSTKTINEQVRILPNGYAKTINLNIGFANPNLALQ